MRGTIVALAAILTLACSDSIQRATGTPDASPDTVGDIVLDVPVETVVPDTVPPDTTEVPEPDVPDMVDTPCESDEECDNGLWCDGAEYCHPVGECRRSPAVDCDDGASCTVDTCNEDTDACENVTDVTMCDDGNPCTDDTCDVPSDTCVHPPVDCSDGVNCTLDTCDETTGACDHVISDLACDDADACTTDSCDVATDTCINTLIDGDGDTYPPESCGGDDCNDADASIHPGAVDICLDGIDQDCSGSDNPGGTCDCPLDVTLPSTTTGDTTGMPSVLEGDCAYGSGSSEVVHSLVLGAPADVHIDVTGTGLYPYVYIRDGSCSGTELDCAYYYSSGINISLTAGTYFIIVDGYSSSYDGPYTLTIRTWVPPTPVTGNNDCSGAYVLTADGSYGGNNSSFTDSARSSCGGGASGFDAWFVFTLSSTATVTLDTGGSDYDTVLHVRRDSCTGTEVACDDDSGPGTTSRINRSFTAGTYYVIVDAFRTSSTGDYVLNVTGL